jgi:hypothetical protein
MDRTYRPTLVVLFIVTLGGFAFAFITGFSIGRFVVVLPVLVTAYAVTYGRGLWVALAGFAVAVSLYFELAWLRPELTYYWGIPAELPICTIAYLIAFVRPPRRTLTAR